MMQCELSTRISILRKMHEVAVNDGGDEENYMEWITYGVPDEPSDDDFRYIAMNDDEYLETVELFNRLYN